MKEAKWCRFVHLLLQLKSQKFHPKNSAKITEIHLQNPSLNPINLAQKSLRMLMNIAYSFLIQLFVNEFETNQLMVCILYACSWQEKNSFMLIKPGDDLVGNTNDSLDDYVRLYVICFVDRHYIFGLCMFHHKHI